MKSSIENYQEKNDLEILNVSDKLPECYKTIIHKQLVKYLQKNIEFFDERSKDFVLKIIPYLKQQKYKIDELIYEKYAVIDSIYILNEGLLV